MVISNLGEKRWPTKFPKMDAQGHGLNGLEAIGVPPIAQNDEVFTTFTHIYGAGGVS